jgi:2-oxo-4-hydroxy-4-carboxy--5-ureidoimidazoline (OHCU) decarboxylase
MAMIGDPEVAIVNAAMAADVRAVTETMAPQLKEKVIGYVKAHPELAEKIAAETK